VKRTPIIAGLGNLDATLNFRTQFYSREMYFAICQALEEDDRRTGLFRDYPPDFFGLVIVDECHGGSARNDSSWRIILEHFELAVSLA
jgi:type I restriction enzyme R subunit